MKLEIIKEIESDFEQISNIKDSDLINHIKDIISKDKYGLFNLKSKLKIENQNKKITDAIKELNNIYKSKLDKIKKLESVLTKVKSSNKKELELLKKKIENK